ncbi:MAG: PSD1 domain-containing protein [Planctomycetia bacterium]|nr:PSD1 domain-containing protein [Planctomycetia bacterium]
MLRTQRQPSTTHQPGRLRPAWVALPLALALFGNAGLGAADDLAKSPVDFNRDVRPILSDNCFKCHGPDENVRQVELRLDAKEGLFRTKDGVTVVAPGKSGESELVRRITSTDDGERMPPPDSDRKLSPAQIELLRRWVEEGAKWQQHWAFEPPKRPPIPAVKNTAWPRGDIDRFILARLEREGFQPAPEAAKETWLRRVTLDLTGLPPALDEIDAFLADGSAGAYEKVVDRLLASPRYGERMAWDWLDAARYADSNGYQGDGNRTMWPWRDWVVKALNDNVPFDRFTIEQLAGDLLPESTLDQRVATGFCRNHMINGEGGRIPEENRIEYIFDQTETLGTIWLGVTIGCSRCHDHKFDPFTRKDYYGLFAFFNNTPVDGGGGSGQTAPVVEVASPDDTARLDELRKKIEEIAPHVVEIEKELFPREEGKPAAESEKATDLPENVKNEWKKEPAGRAVDALREAAKHFESQNADYAKLLSELSGAIEQRSSVRGRIPKVMVMQELPQPRETFVLERGAYNKPTEKVALAVPAALSAFPGGAPQNRLGLAKWLVSPEHPLTARVTVNRVWQQFFGTGLVKTVQDFGVQGERPVNPELLDWLAVDFVESGWNVKRLVKQIVLSAAYRQSSKATKALLERDPENRLLARGPRHRLPSWMLRDQALFVSGLLVDKLGGPSVKPYQPPGIWEEASFGFIKYDQDHGEALYRRSLYIFWRRIVGPTMFFDVASRQVCTVQASRTNTPLHALVTLNEVTFVEAARKMAERVMNSGGASAGERVGYAFRLATGRRPTERERGVLIESLARQMREFSANTEGAKKLLSAGESPRDETLGAAEHAAYTGLCNLILNLDEVLSKE